MRQKVKSILTPTQGGDDSLESSKVNFMDFLELMMKIACFGKHRLGALRQSDDNDEATNKSHSRNPSLKGSNSGKTLGLGQDLSAEKEYDVKDMTPMTIENLFKFLNLNPNKDKLQATLSKNYTQNNQSPMRSNSPPRGEQMDDYEM